MAARVLCRRGLRLRHLPGLRKGFAQAQHMCVQRADETDDQEDKKGVLEHQEVSAYEEYRLHYNPRSYFQSAWSFATSRLQTDNDEDKCLSTRAPSFGQQSNRHIVSSSQHLSSSKNTPPDLDVNKCPEPELPSVSLDNIERTPQRTPQDVKIYPRAFLRCRPGYASFALDPTQRPHPHLSWEEALELLKKAAVLKGSMKTSDVCHFLTELSHLSPNNIPFMRDEHRFAMLLRYSVEHLRLFTPLELLEVLRSFVWLNTPSVHSVLGLYEAELSRRADQMSLHQLLLAADLWRCIGKQVPQFLPQLYNSVRLNLGQIGLLELVHLLYIMGECRQCPEDLIRPVEQLLMRHVHQLYPEEVGVVCLGLFKSQTSISESAVVRIVDKAHSFVEELSDFALVNVMKYLRFSYLFHKAWLEAMAQEVPQRIDRMGVQGLMHVVLASSVLHYRNDQVLMVIAEKIPSLAPLCRCKDTSKLLWAFGTLGFLPVQSPNFYPSLIESLRQRKVEFQQYPEHLLTGLLGLAFVSYFPEDLITLALSPEFINLALKSTQLELKKDLFTLDETVALELPHWTGPRISSKMRKDVTEMLWKFVQSDVCQKLEVQEAEYALQHLLGGPTFVSKRMILPHTRSIDLEVHLDWTGKPIPVNVESDANGASEPHQGLDKMAVGVTITDELLAQLTNNKNTTEPSAPSPTIKLPSLRKVQPDEGWSLHRDTGVFLTSDLREALIRPRSLAASPKGSKNIVKLAIQITHRNHYCYRSQQLLGLHALKRRHLKLAGYRVVELDYQTWFPMLRKSRAEKMAYLHCKIYNSL